MQTEKKKVLVEKLYWEKLFYLEAFLDKLKSSVLSCEEFLEIGEKFKVISKEELESQQINWKLKFENPLKLLSHMGLREKELDSIKEIIIKDFDQEKWDLKYDLPQQRLYEICEKIVYNSALENFKQRVKDKE